MLKKPESRGFDEKQKLRHPEETDELLVKFDKLFDTFMDNRRIPEEDELNEGDN